MPPSSRLCPFCRGLNSADERRCYRCGRALPGPLATGVIGFFKQSLSGDAVMTRIVIGMCVGLFALCMATEHDLKNLPLFSGSFRVSTMLRFGALAPGLSEIEPWRYVSAVFLHFNLLHIGMNCLVGARVGANVERQLGRARFVVLFVVSGVLGFVASHWWEPMAYTVGASGAVFGLFGCAVGVAYARRDPNWKQILVENLVWVVIIGLINGGADLARSSVNNAAHLGGLAAGAALGFLFVKEPRKLRLDVPFGVLAALLLALSAASVVLSSLSPYWQLRREVEIGRPY